MWQLQIHLKLTEQVHKYRIANVAGTSRLDPPRHSCCFWYHEQDLLGFSQTCWSILSEVSWFIVFVLEFQVHFVQSMLNRRKLLRTHTQEQDGGVWCAMAAGKCCVTWVHSTLPQAGRGGEACRAPEFVIKVIHTSSYKVSAVPSHF